MQAAQSGIINKKLNQQKSPLLQERAAMSSSRTQFRDETFLESRIQRKLRYVIHRIGLCFNLVNVLV